MSDDGPWSPVWSPSRAGLEAASVVVAAGPDTPEVLGRLTGFEAFATRFPMNRVPGLLVTRPEHGAREACSDTSTYFDVEPGEIHLRPAPNGGAADGRPGNRWMGGRKPVAGAGAPRRD